MGLRGQKNSNPARSPFFKAITKIDKSSIPQRCGLDKEEDQHMPAVKSIKGIPVEMRKDRYWSGLLHLFINHPKLKMYMHSQWIDLANFSVHAESLLIVSRPWSPSERFMLRLALHLFNERYEINLSDMDRLDHANKKLAIQAIQRRFELI